MPIPRILAALTAAVTIALLPAGRTAADDKTTGDGYISLFNGKDLTGWRTYSDPNPGELTDITSVKDGDKQVKITGKTKAGKVVDLWKVEDGCIVGAGPHSHLFTVGASYTDFKFRVEAKINDKGNSGMFFRTKFGPDFPQGYEAQINATGGDPIKTGSLYPAGGTKLGDYRKEILVMNKAAHEPDVFFTEEVVAEGNHIQIFVNGKKTVDFKDPNSTYTKGHFALQGHDPGTVVTFKRVEYKPLTK